MASGKPPSPIIVGTIPSHRSHDTRKRIPECYQSWWVTPYIITLIYVLGAKVFPQPQTQVDIGELLRTTGFAAGPGVLRVFGIVPGLGPLILLAVSVWMLVAMVIAVRQALDFTSTGRTLMVCAAGWIVMLIMIGLLGGFLGPVAQ